MDQPFSFKKTHISSYLGSVPGTDTNYILLVLIYLCQDKAEDSIPAETQQCTDDREQHRETDEN